MATTRSWTAAGGRAVDWGGEGARLGREAAGAPSGEQPSGSPAPGLLSSAGRRPGSHPPPSALRLRWVPAGAPSRAAQGVQPVPPGPKFLSFSARSSELFSRAQFACSQTTETLRSAVKLTKPSFPPDGLFCDWSDVTSSGVHLNLCLRMVNRNSLILLPPPPKCRV